MQPIASASQTAPGDACGGGAPAVVLCRKCGYDLRGCDAAGRCPECGTPVALSATPDLLRFADPAWASKLGRGVRFILWGTLAAIVSAVVASAVFGETLLGNVVATAGTFVHLYGAWLLTEPDPSSVGRDETLNVRKLVRVAFAAYLAATLLHMLMAASPLPAALVVALPLLDNAATLAEAVGEWAKFRYLGVLAGRIPDPALARQARRLSWWLAGVLGVFTVGAAIEAIVSFAIPPNAMPPALAIVGFVAGAAVILVLGMVMLWSLRVQYRFGKVFRAQAALARQAWAAPAAAPGALPTLNESRREGRPSKWSVWL